MRVNKRVLHLRGRKGTACYFGGRCRHQDSTPFHEFLVHSECQGEKVWLLCMIP